MTQRDLVASATDLGALREALAAAPITMYCGFDPTAPSLHMGNLAQIDTPYLTEGSSGLTFAVDKFMGWPHGGHITLARGERSRLADYAGSAL